MPTSVSHYSQTKLELLKSREENYFNVFFDLCKFLKKSLSPIFGLPARLRVVATVRKREAVTSLWQRQA